MDWYWLLKAVHVLCAVVWVGGMFFAYVVFRPSLSVLEAPQRLALHGQVFRRYFKIIWHVMPLSILTGFAMIFAVFGGMAGGTLEHSRYDATGPCDGRDFPGDLFWTVSNLPGGTWTGAARYDP